MTDQYEDAFDAFHAKVREAGAMVCPPGVRFEGWYLDEKQGGGLMTAVVTLADGIELDADAQASIALGLHQLTGDDWTLPLIRTKEDLGEAKYVSIDQPPDCSIGVEIAALQAALGLVADMEAGRPLRHIPHAVQGRALMVLLTLTKEWAAAYAERYSLPLGQYLHQIETNRVATLRARQEGKAQ